MNVKFDFNAADFKRKTEAALKKAVETTFADIERELRGITDPDTGKPIGVRRSRSGDSYTFTFEASEAGQALAKKRLEALKKRSK